MTGVLGLVACLLALAVLVWTMPKDTAARRTYAVAERAGEWFSWRDQQVRLVRAQVVTSVAGRYSDPVTAGPDAAFVVVEYQARSLREPFSPKHQLVLGDLRIDPLEPFSRVPDDPAQPGFTQSGTVVYQVPRKELPARALSVLMPSGRGLTSYSEFPALRLELGRAEDTLAAPAEEKIEVTR